MIKFEDCFKMSFNQIYVMRGICVTRKEMREIGKIDKSVKGEDLEELLMEKYGDAEDFVSDFQLYTWPCCSKLHHKKYIIGKYIAEIDIDDIFDGPVEAHHWSTNLKLEGALQTIIDHYSLSCRQRTFTVPDGCRFCT